VRFTAFAVARFDAEAGGCTWRAYSAGGCVEVPLEVGPGSFGWGYEVAPGVPVRFEATIEGDTWRQAGFTGTDRRQTFAMELTRTGTRP
jgi:hypothetical protein